MIDQEDYIDLPPLELLLDYLDGILDPDSRLEIEKQIKASDQLASTIEGIRYYYQTEGYSRSQIEEYIAGLQKPLSHDPAGSVKTRKFSYWQIAAGLVLLVWAGTSYLYFQEPTLDELVNNELSDLFPGPPIPRGEQGNIQELWIEVAISYEAGQYDTAIQKLLKIDEVDQGSNSWFYLGLCHLYSNPPQTKKAIEYFKKVTESEHRLAERSKWYLALLYYSEGEVETAKELLREVEINKGLKSKAALRLLDQLE